MAEFFPVEATSRLFEGLDDVQVVFHGINKSGSKAMASVLRRALFQSRRFDEVLSHYHLKGAPPLDEFCALVEAKSGRSFAVGHYLYGALRPRARRIWITQFRHPLPRIVSAYQWLKNKHINEHGTPDGFQTLSEFVREGRGINHSQLVQLGRGYGRFASSDSKRALPPQALFEISVEALDREFTAIAIAEHFEESIFCFASLLGISTVDAWRKDDRNKNRPMVDELSSAERDLIRGVYHWDFELYDHALEKFAEQNAQIRFGSSLDRYKAACSGQYKDRLVGRTADDGMTQRFAQNTPET